MLQLDDFKGLCFVEEGSGIASAEEKEDAKLFLGLCNWSVPVVEISLLVSMALLVVVALIFTPVLYTLLWEKRRDYLEKGKERRNAKLVEEYRKLQERFHSIPVTTANPITASVTSPEVTRRGLPPHTNYRDQTSREEATFRFRVVPAPHTATVSLRAPERRHRTPSVDRDREAADRFVDNLMNDPIDLGDIDAEIASLRQE